MIEKLRQEVHNLKKNEYITVYDENNHLMRSFFWHDGKIIEYVDNFHSWELSDKAYFSLFNSKIPLPFITFYKTDENGWIFRVKQENLQEVQKQLNSQDKNNAKIIYNKLIDDVGKKVNFRDEADGGILVCAVASDEDYYYVIVNENDYKTTFSSCVCKYTIIDENPIQNNKQALLQTVIDKIANTQDVIFTDINFFKNE